MKNGADHPVTAPPPAAAPLSPPDFLTIVSAVFRHLPQSQLQTLSHVAEAVHACLDRSVCFKSVSNAVSLNSVDLLRRVAFHEHKRWRAATKSVWRINSYKMAQFALAMEIVAANGVSVHVAQWLVEEYAPNRSVDTELLFTTAASAGHAAFLTWLAENVRMWKRLDRHVLRVVVEKGHLDVLKWWLKYNNAKAFTSLEVDFAAGEGRLEVLQFMYEHAANPNQPCTIRSMENAGANGDLSIVQWLHEKCGLQATPPAMRGSLEVAKYLYAHRNDDNDDASLLVNEVAIQCAAESGSVEYLEWILALAHSSDGEAQRVDQFALAHVNARSAEVVVVYDHWHVLQWLHDHQRIFCTPEIFRGAVGSGNVAMIDWLATKYPDDWRAATTAGFGLDRVAAGSGYVEMVQWLHANEYPFTPFAMDLAAKFGFLNVVQWLHANRHEGCTTKAMDGACAKGHLAIVQFLHHNRTEGCTVNAMDKAAAKGHLEVVRFLHESGRPEGCTTRAMDHAAWRGHLEIVQYLHVNRTEGCTSWAMDKAASVEMLTFLHENRSEGCTAVAFSVAAANGDLAILDWLYEHKPELLDLVQTRQAGCDHDRYCVIMWAHAIVMEQQANAQLEL